jgi:hypothetical protein
MLIQCLKSFEASQLQHSPIKNSIDSKYSLQLISATTQKGINIKAMQSTVKQYLSFANKPSIKLKAKRMVALGLEVNI